MSKVSVTWNGGLYFTGDDNRGHTVPLESAAAEYGPHHGFLPSELLLAALGACTGMDTVSLLARYGAKVEEFRVELTGTKKEEHPKAFNRITATYYLRGTIEPEQAHKAVSSSYARYSVVANSLSAAIDFKIVLNGSEV